MKILITIILFIIAFTSSFSHDDKKNKCTKSKLGKCTGSLNCNSCKNCKYCAHCNSGGSCGVCSSGYTETKTNTFKPNGTTYKSTNISGVTQYMVNSNTLNIRKSAASNATILCILKLGDTVTFIKSANSQWIKVETTCYDGTTIIGFAFKNLLIKIER
jgi:hypothetical protein